MALPAVLLALVALASHPPTCLAASASKRGPEHYKTTCRNETAVEGEWTSASGCRADLSGNGCLFKAGATTAAESPFGRIRIKKPTIIACTSTGGGANGDYNSNDTDSQVPLVQKCAQGQGLPRRVKATPEMCTEFCRKYVPGCQGFNFNPKDDGVSVASCQMTDRVK